MDYTKIIERLKKYLEVGTKKALAEKLELGNSTVSSWKTRNSINLELIVKKAQGVDLNWLIYGETYAPTPNYINTQEFLSKRTKGLSIPVVLVPEKAKAGYLSDFNTDTIDELPVFNFKNYTNGHRYRAFEITGDSMEPSILSGDVVLCERVEEIQHLKQKSIYVLHTNNGLMCKRFEGQNEQEIILHSNNVNYEATSINSEDIIELWKVLSLHRQF